MTWWKDKMWTILLYVNSNDLGEKNLQPAHVSFAIIACKDFQMCGLPSMSGQCAPLNLYRHCAHTVPTKSSELHSTKN